MSGIEYKDFMIVGDGTFGFKEIKPVGKGSVHLSLRGQYTNTQQAVKAIEYYLSNVKGDKGVKTD